QVRESGLDPATLLGVMRSGHDGLRGGSAERNGQVDRARCAGVMTGRMRPVRDAVLLNAAAGVVAFDGNDQQASDGFEERIVGALGEVTEALDSGRPAALVERWAAASQEIHARRG